MFTPNPFNNKNPIENYIYFSPLTKGITGKAIKINKDLFLPFFCGIDPNTYDGKLIIHKIESLRTTPDHLKSSSGNLYTSSDHTQQLQNFRNQKERMLVVKNAQIIYRIEQKKGDTSPTVYINQIRIINKSDSNAPGFYSRKKLPGSAQRGPATKMEKQSLKHLTVGINGMADSIEDAVNRLNTIALFYNPANVCNDLGLWGGATHSHTTKQAIKQLADGIEFNKSDPVNWKVEGEAVGLLAKALKRVKGTLPKHKFQIVNPKADTPELLKTITDKKGEFLDMFVSHTNSESSLIASASHKEALIGRIGLLPCDKNKRDKVIAKINEATQSAMPVARQASSLGLSNKTFVQALSSAGMYRT